MEKFLWTATFKAPGILRHVAEPSDAAVHGQLLNNTAVRKSVFFFF